MLQISFLCAIIMAITAVIFVILKISKLKTFANNSILFIAIIFIFGVVMFGFFYGATHPAMNTIEKIYNSFYSAIKMFALGNGDEIFKSLTEGEKVIVAYPAILDWNVELVSLVLIRYVAQISALVVVSGAVIAKVYKEISLHAKSFKVSFVHFFDVLHWKSYTQNIVYTDLEYEDLKPFLENIKNDKKAVNKVVILKTSATTQHGQELAEIIKLEGIQVINEGLDYRAFKKFCLFHGTWKINFYSIMFNDSDNLAFGEEAAKFFSNKAKSKIFLDLKKMKHNKTKLEKNYNDCKTTLDTLKVELKSDENNLKLKKQVEEAEKALNKAHEALKFKNRKIKKYKYDVDFYVSFQDESFNSKTNFYRISNGHIKLVSEYSTVATRFVFDNPITRLIYNKSTDIKEQLGKENNVHIYFVGFGGINQAIAAKMLPNYQLPDDKIQVHYHIVSGGADKKTVSEFLNKFPALSDIYPTQKGNKIKRPYNETFLPQKDVASFFDAKSLNFFNEDELHSFAKDLVNDLNELHKAKQSSKHIFIIALGNSQANVDVALRLRTQIRNICASVNDEILETNGCKPVVIYPYIKDNKFFKQPTSLFVRITDAIIQEKKDKSDVNEISEKEYKDMYGKFAKKLNKSYYNNDLSFVFETNYPKEALTPKKRVLKKMNITKKLWFRYFDYFHDASYKYEELPIINFGRGGYIADPSHEALIWLAKHVNRYYCKIDNNFDMEESWVKTNYPNQQSNIGTVLSFPLKANVLGYKISYDDTDAFDDYVHLKDKCKIKKFFHLATWKRADNIVEARFKKYVETCEFLENTRKIPGYFDVLDRAAGFTNDFNVYLNNNSDAVRKELKIPGSGVLTISEVKTAFAKKYDSVLEKYNTFTSKLDEYDEKIENVQFDEKLTKEQKETKVEELNAAKSKFKKNTTADFFNDMEKALSAYYNLVFKSLLTKDFGIIRNIEHNRWYLDKSYSGVVPRELAKIKQDYGSNKSIDGLRHLCMTTNAGLDVLEEKGIRKVVEEGFYILCPKDTTKPTLPRKHKRITSFAELPFNAADKDETEPLISKIFEVNYYMDVFQYRVLMDYIVDNYANMKNNGLHRNKHNYMVRFLNEEKFQEDKKNLESKLLNKVQEKSKEE